MSDSVKDRLRQGKRVMVYCAGPIAHHKIVEYVGFRGGFHAIWIEQEHVPTPQQDLEVLALAARAHGMESMVRLAPTDYATVMRPMEAGVGGVLAAQVRSVEQVEQIVRWAKYPPQGERGLYGSNYESEWATKSPEAHIVDANRDRWLGIQIETSEAVENVEQIASVEGVDHLFIGPGDLSVNLGVPGDNFHPKCIATLERVSRAASAEGKSWGVLPRSREHADTCLELGCALFACAGDMVLLHKGFEAMKSEYQNYFELD